MFIGHDDCVRLLNTITDVEVQNHTYDNGENCHNLSCAETFIAISVIETLAIQDTSNLAGNQDVSMTFLQIL